MERKTKILFLAARLPYPLVGGDRVKPHYLLKHLAGRFDVTLITFSQGRHYRAAYVRHLEEMGIHVKVIKVNPLRAGLMALLNAFRFPLEIGYYYSKEFRSEVERTIEQGGFRIGFSFFMRTAEYLKDSSGQMKKVLIAEDCRTLYQQRSSAGNRSFIQRAVRAFERIKLRKSEPEIVNHFDAVTFVTDTDIEAMRLMNPDGNYFLLSDGFDAQRFSPAPDGAKRYGVLFCGKLDVAANALMAERCVERIFPVVRRSIHDASLTIAGANPSKSLRKRAEASGIEIVADPPDMAELLRHCQVFLHPHTGGSGIQNKLIEAMACGAPIVTTPTGVQGIALENGVHGLIAETDEELARCAIQLLTDGPRAAELGAQACKSANENHRWESVFRAFDALIDSMIGEENREELGINE